MRCVFTSAIFTIGICTAYAQPKNAEIKPGVNAGQFLSAVSGDNSLQTGQLSVNIPLFNLQGKGVDVPITLSFNAGNINHQSDASPVGLGWSLLAGGVITRTVRDRRDEETTSLNDVPWQYDGSYIQNKLAESGYNPLTGLMVQKLDYMIAFDKEADVMNYSFLGFSGDIYNRRNTDGSFTRKISPNISFKLEDTSLGYKIIDDKGVEYFFEAKEQNGYNTNMSWFLTKIKTPQGGEVSFQYADENAFDPTDKLGGSPYTLVKSKRLTRIDYDYGYVTFGSAQREDMYYNGASTDAKRITTIELHDKGGSLIKGYELGNNGYIIDASTFTTSFSATWRSKRMKLSTLKEYGSNMQYNAPYEFDYDFYFHLNKASDQNEPFAIPKNTWAHNPVVLYSVDRSQWGELVPHLDGYWNSDEQEYQYTVGGVTVTNDNIAGTVGDYFCMTRMKFPSGGEESYSYEAHTYSYLGTYSDPELVNAFNGTQYIQGKRLRKKETKDNNGNTLISEYKYFDGILINPSIHNSTMYTSNRLHYNTPYLEASAHYTQNPQNNRTGAPVYYGEVEEDFLSATGASNGKKIYYFEKMYSQPATNYLYANTTHLGENILVNLPNVLGGKQPYLNPEPAISIMSNAYATYLAYPVGRFFESELSKGILLKELTYSAGGQLIRKTESEYATNYGSSQTLFGYIVEKFDDTIYEPSYPDSHTYRYLISQMVNTYGAFRQLSKTTTTNYFQTDSVKEEKTFNYTNKNLLRSSAITQSTGSSITTEHVYPDDVQFQTQSGLSAQATSIKRMNETNMVSYPLQSTVKKGEQYIQGSYITYKQLANGTVVADTVFSLQKRPGIVLSSPLVNSTGKLERSSNFMPEGSTLSYDANVNPATTVNGGGIAETTIWGYGGQYPIAKIANYTYDQVQNNAALLTQLALLDDYTIIATDVIRANISICNQAIRNSLPQSATVATYTYAPLVGVTSATDARGLANYYEYDSLQRLINIKDKDGNIVKHIDYHYANQ